MLIIRENNGQRVEIKLPWLDKIEDAILPHMNAQQAPTLALLLIYMLIDAIKEAPPDKRSGIATDIGLTILAGVKESLT